MPTTYTALFSVSNAMSLIHSSLPRSWDLNQSQFVGWALAMPAMAKASTIGTRPLFRGRNCR